MPVFQGFVDRYIISIYSWDLLFPLSFISAFFPLFTHTEYHQSSITIAVRTILLYYKAMILLQYYYTDLHFEGKLRKRGEPIVVRSGHVLAIGEWHRVVAEHRGRRIFLRVDGIVHSAGMLPGEMLPSSGSPLYLG
jgi:hypothetical protein